MLYGHASLRHLHSILFVKLTYPAPTVHFRHLPGSAALAAATLIGDDDQSLRLHGLPPGDHGAVRAPWGSHLFVWYIQKKHGLSICRLGHVVLILVRRDILQRPDLFGTLPGCRSPNHLFETEKRRRAENPKCHHLLCLAVVSWNVMFCTLSKALLDY